MDETFVAILVADVAGAASFFARAGDDAADPVLRAAVAALRGAVEAHGGREIRSTGAA